MDKDQARSRVIEDIATVGELTRMVSQRYDGMFADFYAVLREALETSPDMESAALAAMDISDAAVETVRGNFSGQPRFACAKGCSPCCHLFVAVPPGVAEAIATYVERHFTAEARDEVVVRLEAKVAVEASAADPMAARSPCALLDAEGACSIYPVRPLSCRSFTSTSLPRCNQVVFGDVRDGSGVEQNPARYRLYELATRAIEETARRRGLLSQQRGLSSALLAQLRG